MKNSKRYDEAEREYREAIQINSNYAYVHNNLGISLVNLNHYEEAEKEYGEAIRINPNCAEAHYNLGYLYKEIGKNSEAREEILKAKELFEKRRKN